MLLSMTGYGDARVAHGKVVLHTELRAVNNRFFKLQCRIPDRYAAFEAPLEKLVKQNISRGTVTLSINRSLESSFASAMFDEAVVREYLDQWNAIRKRGGEIPKLRAREILELPGVVVERENGKESAEDEWKLVEESLEAALEKFQAFRKAEGSSMTDDLQAQIGVIDAELARIEQRAPQVVSQYRDRILVRVSEL
ncbi:MAG TPA: YicC/YloC family endoribonuclease, partial [Planctomycetaceae bacterium]|nr:YicC/YloC family endoribonuclease [Planctomycetaceae bacterium]